MVYKLRFAKAKITVILFLFSFSSPVIPLLLYSEATRINQNASAHKIHGVAHGSRGKKKRQADRVIVISFAAYDSCYIALGNRLVWDYRDAKYCIQLPKT